MKDTLDSAIVRQSAAGDVVKRVKAIFTRQAGESLTDRIEAISNALRAKFIQPGTDRYGSQKYRFYYPKEIFDDYLITTEDVTAKLFKIPYIIEGDAISFGEPVLVEETFIEVAAQPGAANQQPETITAQGADHEQVIALAAAEFVGSDPDKTFTKTRWILARFGPAAHKQLLRKEAFERSLEKWAAQGSKCYLNHPPESDYYKLPERDLNFQIGWWSDHKVTAQGFEGTLNLVPSADKFRLDLKAAVEGGRRDFFQPSILGFASGKNVQHDGGTWFEVQDFKTAFSIDMVNAGGAASEFQYAIHSAGMLRNIAKQGSEAANHKGANTMDPRILAALFKQNPTRFALVRQAAVAVKAEGVTDQSTEEEVATKIIGNEALVSQSLTLMQQPPAGGEGGEDPIAARAREAAAAGAVRQAANPAELQFRQLPKSLRDIMVAQAFTDSNLDTAVQQSLRTDLGADPDLADVQRAIEQSRKIVGIVEQSNGGRGMVINPGSRIDTGLASLDKLRIAVNKAFGNDYDGFKKNESISEVMARQSGHAFTLPDESAWNSVPAIRSLAKFYADMTGDMDLTCEPRFQRITRQAQTPWLPSDFTVLMQDAMHKRLLAGYREVDYGWQRIATIKAPKDFRTQHVIKWGYLSDIPTVDTAAGAAYTTAAAPADTEETYAPNTTGVLIELTRRDLLNDDLGAFSLNILRLGRADHRTLAKLIWLTCLFENPVLAEDSKTLYHADHFNLIDDALSTTGIANALTAMMTHTEPGSGERMDFSPDGLTLAVPVQEWWNAIKLTDLNNEPGGNADALGKELRGMGIYPQKLPILTDTNNWALFCNKNDVEHVEVGFVQGNVEPEFFSMDGELSEKAFGNDIVLRYKLRHEYGAAPVDHRGSVKSVVTGA